MAAEENKKGNPSQMLVKDQGICQGETQRQMLRNRGALCDGLEKVMYMLCPEGRQIKTFSLNKHLWKEKVL